MKITTLQDVQIELNGILNTYFRQEAIDKGRDRYFDKVYITDDMVTRDLALKFHRVLKEFFIPEKKGGE